MGETTDLIQILNAASETYQSSTYNFAVQFILPNGGY